MTTITREQAQKIIEAADEVISALAGTNEDVHPGSDNMLRLWDDLNDRYAPPEVVRELARIALASLEAEPVAWLHSDNGLGIPAITRSKNIADSWLSRGWYVQPLYMAQPVSVVPDALPSLNNGIVGFDEGWNACRAVMLHGAEPVSQTYKLNKLSGNSPVTPDGWISCSERMPEDTKMLLAFSQGEIVAAYWNWVVNPIDYKKYRAFTYLSGNILDDVTHWMPLPEPPQEVK
ncbi:DUF551 domain-containing protein [Escherichia coli]|nr:DUF551 domain-containing protein [Escherichia coli]HDI8738194.1 DUF551 domain-containing protein [Escherichia coli]